MVALDAYMYIYVTLLGVVPLESVYVLCNRITSSILNVTETVLDEYFTVVTLFTYIHKYVIS